MLAHMEYLEHATNVVQGTIKIRQVLPVVMFARLGMTVQTPVPLLVNVCREHSVSEVKRTVALVGMAFIRTHQGLQAALYAHLATTVPT